MRKKPPVSATETPKPLPKGTSENRIMLLLQPEDLSTIDELRAHIAPAGLELTRQKTIIAALHQLKARVNLEARRRTSKPRKPLRNR